MPRRSSPAATWSTWCADDKGHAQLAQIPEAQSALVALDPNDGSIVALVGGFDYFTNKYNRVTQARRLPGSGFKPFLYSAALEHGFTPASVILDAPIVLDGSGNEDSWRPENVERAFGGPTRMREALVHSRNLVSIRILKAIGIQSVIDYVPRFGFDPKTLPHDLTMALGTMEVTPLDLATAYAVFANGGYRVQPYFIERIEDAAGTVVWRAVPKRVCTQCEQAASPGVPGEPGAEAVRVSDGTHGEPAPLPPEEVAPRVITPQNAYVMDDMMADVIKRGTGRARAARSVAATSPARPAPPTRRRTPGSTASPPTSSPRCGWGSIRSVRWATPRKARTPRCRSG